eukprot:CAMPEP_0181301422 /NCGR_PEP_ID=MMETSP1101-20121128/7416_1 /TAXON_ID=46948 /ORGANISM="Rhodomonas abbreviata, Strain Caron Lab Isolate" /LENGTH=309 /DNA_ID=CAMNT_0023406727 /DNA_START=221 /DNA_END=1146 /DNA_ORIENTATION=+
MLLEKPTRIRDNGEDWLEIHSNRAFTLQRYRRGGLGKGLQTIQAVLTAAKLLHGSPRTATSGVPWDFRIITTIPVRNKPIKQPSHSPRLESDEEGRAAKDLGPSYVWQLAGSNNLLHCKQDMDALVLKLNTLLTEVDMSTLMHDRPEERTLEDSNSGLVLLLESLSQALQLQAGEQEGVDEIPSVLLNRERASSVVGPSTEWSDVMQLVVFIVLPPSSLFMCAQVCRSWSKLASHDVLWKGHLKHLNSSLEIMDYDHMHKAVGRMVVEGMVTYKYLYTVTFLEAVRRREGSTDVHEEEGFLDGRLSDVG